MTAVDPLPTMIKNRWSGMFRTILGFLLAASSVQAGAEIACPDETALRLLGIARNAGTREQFPDRVTAYSYVIENASRPMDGPARRTACFRLARFHYSAEHCTMSIESSCSRPLNEVINKIIAGHPVLERCPEKAIHRDAWLPIERYAVEPSIEILAQEITGWVEFKITIDQFGAVESATITGSSGPTLEPASIEAVMKFKYEPRYVSFEQVRAVRVTDVQATVVTDYFDLARAKGCRWKTQRFQ